MNLKERIRGLRKVKGWGQKELASRIGVTQSTVAGWESGRHEVTPTHRKRLCAVFGISMGELFGEGPAPQSFDQEILNALNDPVAVKALLVTYKNKQDIKNAIRIILDCLPHLSPKKRQALIELCR